MHELVIVYIDNDKENFVFNRIENRYYIHVVIPEVHRPRHFIYLYVHVKLHWMGLEGKDLTTHSLPLPIEIQLPDNLKPLLSFVDI